jgi:signal peptidase I
MAVIIFEGNPVSESVTAAPAVRRFLRNEWLQFAGVLLLLAVTRTSLANHYQVPSGSMQPTLEPGDRVVVDMRAYGLRVPFTDIELVDNGDPRPGDVVVFKSG